MMFDAGASKIIEIYPREENDASAYSDANIEKDEKDIVCWSVYPKVRSISSNFLRE
jgi:hypothetical protein